MALQPEVDASGAAGNDQDYGATIVDHGTWPRVERGYLTLADIKTTLKEATHTDSAAAAIIAAVKTCSVELFDRQWQQGDGADGAVMALDRLGVDANWGPFADEVYKAIRESPHRAQMVPTHGNYFGAKQERRYEDMKLDPSDRGGIGWRLVRNPAKLKRGLPYLLVDTNRWKTFVDKHLQASPGTAGSVMFNGKPLRSGDSWRYTERQQMLVDHLLSEKCTMVSAHGRTVPEWSIKRVGRDNQKLDNVVACYAMANDLGIREPTAANAKASAPRSFKAVMAAAAEKRGATARPASGYAKFRRGPAL